MRPSASHFLHYGSDRQALSSAVEPAVSLVIEQGYSASNVGKRLGIHHSSISRWVREHQEREGSTDGLSRADIEAENRRLKKEIKRLEMEREILKKAAAFFAKESS